MELQDEIKIANEEYKQVLEESSKTLLLSRGQLLTDNVEELVKELQLALDHTLGESPNDISIQQAYYPAGTPYDDQTHQ